MKKVIFLFLLISSIVFSQQSAPQISSPNRFHNFGDLREGQIVSHSFIIKNTGTDTLKIFNVRTSCGCTAAEMPKKILAPGDSTVLRVTFNTKNKKGAQQKYIYLTSNDPQTPKFKLVLKAEVFDKNANIKAIKNGPRLRLQTHQISFGKLEKGVKKTARIRFMNVGKLPLKITYVKPSSKCLEAFVNRYQLAPGESGILEVTIDTSDLQGAISRTIAFKTNDPLEPTQMLMVFVEIKEENKDKK